MTGWACMGGSRSNQNDYVFVILVTHPKSYIETTDRRDFGGKPSKCRWGRPGAFGRYRTVPKSGHETITKKNQNLHIDTRRKIHWFQKCYSFRSTTKITKLSRKTRFRTVASPGACERLTLSNRRSSSIHPSSLTLNCSICTFMDKLCGRPPQYVSAPPPASWPFDPESGVRVACDVGYLCANNFSLPRPLCSRLRSDVRDRQTDVVVVRRQTRIIALCLRCIGAEA